MGTLGQLIHYASVVYIVLIIARAIMSWVSPSFGNPLVRWVYRATDPLLRPIQSIVPALGGIDFSPVIAIILVQLAERLLLSLIYQLS